MKSVQGIWLLMVGAVVALVASAFPARVEATCGDYVRLAHHERLPGHEHLPIAPHPCDGPGCSSHSDIPMTPAPATPTPSDWAVATIDVPFLPHFGEILRADPASDFTLNLQWAIFEPPR